MTIKQVPFSNARKELSTLIDEVQKSGRPITITKRGRPAAILMSVEVLEKRLSTQKSRPWTLRGSGTWQGNPEDIDTAIKELRKDFRKTTGDRLKRAARGIAND